MYLVRIAEGALKFTCAECVAMMYMCVCRAMCCRDVHVCVQGYVLS